MLRGELDLQQHVIGPEDLRQHPAGVSGRQDVAVGCPLRGCQLLALLEADRHAVGVHQQVVLGQEPGEEHPVPVLVGELLGQVLDGLSLIGRLDVTRLLAPRLEPSPEPLVVLIEVRVGLGLLDRPFLKCR